MAQSVVTRIQCTDFFIRTKPNEPFHSKGNLFQGFDPIPGLSFGHISTQKYSTLLDKMMTYLNRQIFLEYSNIYNRFKLQNVGLSAFSVFFSSTLSYLVLFSPLAPPFNGVLTFYTVVDWTYCITLLLTRSKLKWPRSDILLLGNRTRAIKWAQNLANGNSGFFDQNENFR